MKNFKDINLPEGIEIITIVAGKYEVGRMDHDGALDTSRAYGEGETLDDAIKNYYNSKRRK